VAVSSGAFCCDLADVGTSCADWSWHFARKQTIARIGTQFFYEHGAADLFWLSCLFTYWRRGGWPVHGPDFRPNLICVVSGAVGFSRWAAVAIGFGGAMLVVWPQDGNITALAFVPIIAGVFYAVGAIGTRAWCEGESVLVMTLAYFVILGVYGLLGVAALTIWSMDAPFGVDGWLQRGFVPMTVTMIWVTMGQAVGSIIVVGLLTRGYQLVEASYVAINEYSLILFAAIFGWIMWGQTLGVLALFGIACIIALGSIIALRSK
jgi:drug/metabolite transporter (DMT)-like permease